MNSIKTGADKGYKYVYHLLSYLTIEELMILRSDIDEILDQVDPGPQLDDNLNCVFEGKK